jgi:hypothetical protein
MGLLSEFLGNQCFQEPYSVAVINFPKFVIFDCKIVFLVRYDVQKGRPARPQGARTPRRTRGGYVEGFERLRT